MAVNEKGILNRLYFIAGCMFVFGFAVLFKLFSIQFFQGDKYRALVKSRDIKDKSIPANRGNVYADDGSLLATSIPKYNIAIDAVISPNSKFEEFVKPLCDSLSNYSGKSSSYYEKAIRKARANENQYLLLAKNINYTDYIRFRNFPLLELGAIPGGLIVNQETKREYPMGRIAQRFIGYERFDDQGNVTRAGIEGAFGEKYLRGVDGLRKKQKIGKDKWKPVNDYQVEPKDGYDVYTTINVNIQDIAHHSLLGQLEYYKAEHGCVVVMDVKTGDVKAISNLAKTKNGNYYEKRNYAVWESHEPGSTFKVMALMAALEDKVIDTSAIIDTKNGSKRFYGRTISDSRAHGKISVARALEVSSNIGLATIIDDNYAKQPERFLKYIKNWNLHKPLGLSIKGEGLPVIPEPGDNIWSRNALPSMAYGYNLQMTPLQTLTFYNAIANNGEMVKPRFINAVKEFDENIEDEDFNKEIVNKKICSDKTLKEIKEVLKNIVVRGTGKSLYSDDFSMAGKTGTARTDYSNYEVWKKDKKYISSFVGYFPVENPKYSCIVVIHKPSIEKGYYGADVTGPVFKRIAQKIFTDTPLVDEVESLNVKVAAVENEYKQFYETVNRYKTIMPDVVGLPAMDALAILENMDVDLKVKLHGNGVVNEQSINKSTKLEKNQTIILKAS